MKKWPFVVLLLVGATVLGATVLREPIAGAAQDLAVTIIGPLDARGNVKVHEQGTARVDVTNSSVAVEPDLHLTNRFVFRATLDLDTQFKNFTVPDGKVLVVEHLNVDVLADADRLVSANLIYQQATGTPPDPAPRTNALDVPLLPGPTSPTVNRTQYGYDSDLTLKIWPGPNTFSIARQDGTRFVFASVSLSGYLVDAP